MNDQEDPSKKMGNNKTVRESNAYTNQHRHTLEKDGHQKKHFNVLHEMAALPICTRTRYMAQVQNLHP